MAMREREGAAPAADRRTDAAAEAGEAARAIADDARGGQHEPQLRASLAPSTQKDLLAQKVDGLAGALRRAAVALDDEGQGPYARIAEQAGERLSDLTLRLRTRDLRDLAADAERFARREPLLFFGGAVVAGLALARLLKSATAEPVDGARAVGDDEGGA
jgi:hypothetical protein